MVELEFLRQLFQRRLEMVERITPIRIEEPMRQALEATYTPEFSQALPYRCCYLGLSKDKVCHVFPVSVLSVAMPNQVFIADTIGLDEVLVEGSKACLLTCHYRKFEHGQQLIVTPIPVMEMQGWQFKGTIHKVSELEVIKKLKEACNARQKELKQALLLKVEEIYCAVTGRRIQ